MSDTLEELKELVSRGPTPLAHAALDNVGFAEHADTLLNMKLHLDNALDNATLLHNEIVDIRERVKALMSH